MIRSRLMRFALLLASCTIVAATASAAQVDTDRDGIPDMIELKVGSPVDAPQKFVLVATSPDAGYDEAAAKRNAPDIVRLEACHVAQQRLLFKITFARHPDFVGGTFILYLDADNNPATGRVDKYHGGVDVMVCVHDQGLSNSLHNPSYNRNNTFASGAVHGNALYLGFDAPLRVEAGQVQIGVHLLSQRAGGSGDSTKHVVAKLPFHADRKAPKWEHSTSLRSLADYRFYNNKVKYERLADKGMTYEQIAPAKPIEFGRPKPPVPFAASHKPGQPGTIARERVAVNLLEEAGVARAATDIRFGLPLPKGGLFDLANMRVLSPAGDETPAQFTATAFWPDDSLKWVLVEFAARLAAKASATYAVEFGNDVKPAARASSLRVDETREAITVNTGPLKVVLDKQRFNIFRGVWLDGKRVAASAPCGVRMVDEHGQVFTLSGARPKEVKIEQRGPLRVVVRVAGDYADAAGNKYMSYVTRLTFRAGSPRVTVAHTHVDTYIKTEFTDITSLSMPVEFAATRAIALAPGKDGNLTKQTADLGAGALSVAEFDEQRSTISASGRRIEAGPYPGALRLEGPAGALGVAVHEFWQRWPKALRADSKQCAIGLLPAQPGADYGKDLPFWLMFSFVDGKYRFKWGMSFSTRITFDFGGGTRLAELAADANLPVVAVVPASWYASTKALGTMAAPMGKQFSTWDRFAERSYKAHMLRKRRQREYGYFNYGDWYGERGRNWGNNEYDMAHAMFMQFARTGRRNYYRLGLAAARHQADVDCVHAYPDPAYIGANHQHSIGHTGTWSQRPLRATWSHRYDSHTSACNGHTWASGMMDAWYLAGEPRVMSAAIGLGEHIAWAMSRTFTRLGTHERSAGWSLHAIMAVYNGTYDPVYLEAAKRIAAVALREQKFDQGGAWPHVLPRDHCGGHIGAVGNNLFLIGILLDGLEDYHKATADPAVAKSIISGARWVIKSWDENAEGWPYSAAVDGARLYPKASPSLNTLIAGPLVYAGRLTREKRFIEIAETAFGAVARGGAASFGKSVAQQMHFGPDIMGQLQQWYAEHRPDKGIHVLDGSAAGMERVIAKTRDARRHTVRAPNEKLFFVKTSAKAELVASRRPHGAMHKDWEFGTITVLDAAGRTVKQGKFSTDGAHEFRAALDGNAQFKVVVRDDQRGVWSLAGDGAQIVMQTVPGFRIGGVGRGRYHFFVPEGTHEFSVKLLGVHTGTYGGAVVGPDGRLAAMHQGANIGRTHIKGAPKPTGIIKGEPERYTIVVKPKPAQTGQMWSLVLWASGDIGCELVGVPPYLALTRAAWFEPKP